MGCYYILWYNTYVFSLLFYKIYMKRENAGSWNSGPERSKSERPILHNSKSPENLRRIILEYIKKYWTKKIPEGPHQVATSLGARPLGMPLGLVGPLAGLSCPSSIIWR